jgi:hypothetical protein
MDYMTAIITREPIKIMADIILHELELTAGQVMIYNQRYTAPTTEGLYIVLAFVSAKVIGNNNTPTDNGAVMDEVQETSVLQVIQIDVMSANEEARQRKEEIIMALNSTYAQQLQDQYLVKIASHPSDFVDVSDVEGTARMNRYTMTVMVNALYRKTKAIDFYGTFTEEVNTHV